MDDVQPPPDLLLQPVHRAEVVLLGIPDRFDPGPEVRALGGRRDGRGCGGTGGDRLSRSGLAAGLPAPADEDDHHNGRYEDDRYRGHASRAPPAAHDAPRR